MSDYANSRTLIYAGTEMKPGSAHETLQIQNHGSSWKNMSEITDHGTLQQGNMLQKSYLSGQHADGGLYEVTNSFG